MCLFVFALTPAVQWAVLLVATQRKPDNKSTKDGQMWNVVTGGISAIDELTEGVRTFYQELCSDEVAQYSAEVCIVTFGGTAPQLIVDFSNIDRQPELPQLIANGDTPMG